MATEGDKKEPIKDAPTTEGEVITENGKTYKKKRKKREGEEHGRSTLRCIIDHSY